MALHTKLYAETPGYTVSYEWDDATLRLTRVFGENRMTVPLTIEIVRSADDVVLDTYSVPANTTFDQALTGAQRRSVTLDAMGRITNIYARIG